MSIVLPVFDAEPYVQDALASLLSQDYDNLEIIAIDDGSTDGSLETLQRLARRDGRLSVTSRENRGLIATLNEGLGLARGRFVARMDADDLSYLSRISKQVALLLAAPGTALCGSAYDTLSKGRVTRGRIDEVLQDRDLADLSLFFTLFKHSTVMFDRAVIAEGELRYDAGYPHAEDFELFTRLAQAYPTRVLRERLVAYRLHEGAVTARHIHAMRATHLRLVSEHLAARGLLTDAGPLAAVAAQCTYETAVAAGAFVRDLAARLAAQGASTGLQAGCRNLFHFLYGLLRDAREPDLVRAYLDAARGWRLIRRTERVLLGAPAPAPATLAALDLAQAARHAGQRLLSSAPPRFDVATNAPRRPRGTDALAGFAL